MRLTKWKLFRTNRRLYRVNNGISISDLTWKLGQLEDVEEELGIDLATLFKALKNGFWFKGQYGGLFKGFGTFDLKRLAIIMDEDDGYFSEFKLSDFGNHWALTKEALQ